MLLQPVIFSDTTIIVELSVGIGQRDLKKKMSSLNLTSVKNFLIVSAEASKKQLNLSPLSTRKSACHLFITDSENRNQNNANAV